MALKILFLTENNKSWHIVSNTFYDHRKELSRSKLQTLFCNVKERTYKGMKVRHLVFHSNTRCKKNVVILKNWK
jgi:hypothetical protein